MLHSPASRLFACLTLSALVTLAAFAQTAAPAKADPAPADLTARLKQLEERRDADYAKGGSALMNRNILAAAEELMREYPSRPEPVGLLLDVALDSEDQPARELFTKIQHSPAAAERAVKFATSQLARLDRVGQPLALKFTTLDGQPFDLAAHRGKVVVIDWWATWCGPCVAELPHFKEVVARYAPRGVVFVGISLDQKKEALVNFIAEHAMTWPQFFDGQGWKNQFATEFGIRSIPAVWLIDQQGVLRDTFGRGELEQKLDRLLAH